jgi:hypothetical protein
LGAGWSDLAQGDINYDNDASLFPATMMKAA